ncbi:hypothetical protein CJ738_36775, partial [Klebsiella pneumoniae]
TISTMLSIPDGEVSDKARRQLAVGWPGAPAPSRHGTISTMLSIPDGEVSDKARRQLAVGWPGAPAPSR